jgi:hypothetical protein
LLREIESAPVAEVRRMMVDPRASMTGWRSTPAEAHRRLFDRPFSKADHLTYAVFVGAASTSADHVPAL